MQEKINCASVVLNLHLLIQSSVTVHHNSFPIFLNVLNLFIDKLDCLLMSVSLRSLYTPNGNEGEAMGFEKTAM